MDAPGSPDILRFGSFELDVAGGQLLRDGVSVKLQPQPFKLLVLLVSRAGVVVSREDIRRHLWPDGTFVDFDQSVNFCVRQIREALRDSADRPVFIQTVPKRGYRFAVPVATASKAKPHNPTSSTTMRLQKILWTNVAELRMAEARRARYTWMVFGVAVLIIVALATLLFMR